LIPNGGEGLSVQVVPFGINHLVVAASFGEPLAEHVARIHQPDALIKTLRLSQVRGQAEVDPLGRAA
jgi:hypothetical protein